MLNLADGVSSGARSSVYSAYSWRATIGISGLGDQTSSQLDMTP